MCLKRVCHERVCLERVSHERVCHEGNGKNVLRERMCVMRGSVGARICVVRVEMRVCARE